HVLVSGGSARPRRRPIYDGNGNGGRHWRTSIRTSSENGWSARLGWLAVAFLDRRPACRGARVRHTGVSPRRTKARRMAQLGRKAMDRLALATGARPNAASRPPYFRTGTPQRARLDIRFHLFCGDREFLWHQLLAAADHSGVLRNERSHG